MGILLWVRCKGFQEQNVSEKKKLKILFSWNGTKMGHKPPMIESDLGKKVFLPFFAFLLQKNSWKLLFRFNLFVYEKFIHVLGRFHVKYWSFKIYALHSSLQHSKQQQNVRWKLYKTKSTVQGYLIGLNDLC